MALHIGKELRTRVKQSGIPITRFAKRIGCSAKTVHALFKRPSIDTMILKKSSEVLRFDFFALYTAELGDKTAPPKNDTADPVGPFTKGHTVDGLEIVIRPGPQDKDMIERLLQALNKGGK